MTLPYWGELGQGFRLVIGDVDIARTVGHQVGRAEELALPAPVAAELADEPPLPREHLDPAVPAVGDVHLAIGADRDLPLGFCRGARVGCDEPELAAAEPGLPQRRSTFPAGEITSPAGPNRRIQVAVGLTASASDGSAPATSR
jgi:hypothetical protein